MERTDLVSVIVPVLNEEKHIVKLMDALARQTYPFLEFLLTDGGSTDATAGLISERSNKDPRFKIIHNPHRYVSHGFNLALKEARGNFIAFLGAHAVYPENYIELGCRILKNNIADAVGGPLRHEGLSPAGKAIALAMTSGFGVGNTAFRTSSAQQFVDSVAFAVYKRSVFDELGGLDEDLIRNQDDEFHYRMNAAGLKILMTPEMQAVYFVRSSFIGLFKQYYQYGLYKPLVLKKVNSGARWRHFIPSLWVIYLISLPVFCVTLPSAGLVFLIPLLLYLLTSIFMLLRSGGKTSPFFLFLAFATLHLSYGLGFLKGSVKIL